MGYLWIIAALAAAIVIAGFAAKAFKRRRLHMRHNRSRASDPRVQRAARYHLDRPVPSHGGSDRQAPRAALDWLRVVGQRRCSPSTTRPAN